nr:MAG TPA: hypothetical protein [Caudoviricetes sp.]
MTGNILSIVRLVCRVVSQCWGRGGSKRIFPGRVPILGCSCPLPPPHYRGVAHVRVLYAVNYGLQAVLAGFEGI